MPIEPAAVTFAAVPDRTAVSAAARAVGAAVVHVQAAVAECPVWEVHVDGAAVGADLAAVAAAEDGDKRDEIDYKNKSSCSEKKNLYGAHLNL